MKYKVVDPLFQLFEHNLFNRSYDDIGAFTREVAEEYLAYLDSTHAHVPFHLRAALLKDLEGEAHEMLIKKMYGCVKPRDYTNAGTVMSVEPTEEFVDVNSQKPKKAPTAK
ncbi:MAG: hypothetical protein KDD51_00010 [Bdellovibrionales bacterium]|nr:hypothetical protein [Bdellovibrionales bacterium]